METRFINNKISEEVLDILTNNIRRDISLYKGEEDALEAEGEDLRKRLSNLSSSEKSPLLGRISEMNSMELSRIVHEEIEKIIIIKGKKRYDYVLGIQFFGGNYVMVDANARYKRIWDEGVEVAYKKLH